MVCALVLKLLMTDFSEVVAGSLTEPVFAECAQLKLEMQSLVAVPLIIRHIGAALVRHDNNSGLAFPAYSRNAVSKVDKCRRS
jgi:hypothetical protein